MSERPVLGRWLAEYRCGCTVVEQRKRDLLEYCPKHGENRRHVHKLRMPTKVGRA